MRQTQIPCSRTWSECEQLVLWRLSFLKLLERCDLWLGFYFAGLPRFVEPGLGGLVQS